MIKNESRTKHWNRELRKKQLAEDGHRHGRQEKSRGKYPKRDIYEEAEDL